MALPLPSPEPAATAIDTVFEKLLSDIVGGVYAAGRGCRPSASCPASSARRARPCARRCAGSASGTWSSPGGGRGRRPRPYRNWSMEVIAAYLRYGKPEAGQPTIARILLDLLAVRRAVVLEVIRLTASRVPRGGTAGARAAMARAWSLARVAPVRARGLRGHAPDRGGGAVPPGLWLLNRFLAARMEAAGELSFAVRPPEDYVAVHSKFFESVEAGDTDGACRIDERLPRAPRRRPREGPAGERMTYRHTPTARRVLRSLVPVICPPEAVPLADAIVDHMALTDERRRADHAARPRRGLLAYDLGALPRYLRRAHALPPDRAERYYASWGRGPTPIQVQLARALNQVMSLACYEQPEIMEAVGYDVAPWIEQVKHKRLTVFADDVRRQDAEILAPDPLRPRARQEVA